MTTMSGLPFHGAGGKISDRPVSLRIWQYKHGFRKRCPKFLTTSLNPDFPFQFDIKDSPLLRNCPILYLSFTVTLQFNCHKSVQKLFHNLHIIFSNSLMGFKVNCQLEKEPLKGLANVQEIFSLTISLVIHLQRCQEHLYISISDAIY